MHARVRERVHLVHYKRRFVPSRSPRQPVCGANCPITASEKCHQEKRKTVNGEDILFAMTSLGFENYAEALKIYLSKYREVHDLKPMKTVSLGPKTPEALPLDADSVAASGAASGAATFVAPDTASDAALNAASALRIALGLAEVFPFHFSFLIEIGLTMT